MKNISGSALAEMTRKQTGETVENSYGLCWEINGAKIGHGGAYKTHMGIDRARGLITVLLIHHTNEWHNDDAKNLHALFASSAEKLV
jgi:CubicO group peptidase (beta-lactamase class C family)